MSKKKDKEESQLATQDEESLLELNKEVDWYQALRDEVDAIVVETTHHAREVQIKGFHLVGKRIRQDAHLLNVSTLVFNLASDIGKPERWLWYAVKFYDNYPDLKKELEKFEEGKNLSVNKIITNYLGGPSSSKKELTMKEVAEKIFEKYSVADCKKIIKELEKLVA